MSNGERRFPNLTWDQFAVCNDNATGAFEDMSRRLFSSEFLGGESIPHSDHNNPGVEVIPILEPLNRSGAKQRKISFQAKYFQASVSCSKIKESMNQAIKHYGKELDLVYLFCNKTLTTTSKGYKGIEELLKKSDIELIPISDTAVLDMVSKHKEIAYYFFLPRIRPGEEQFNNMHADIIVNADCEECHSCPIKANEQYIDSRLLQSFVQEKVRVCKDLILEMQLDELRKELDRIFSYNLSGVAGADVLLFYRLIVDLHDGKEIDTSVNGLTEQYETELSWLKQYYKDPRPISAYEYARHCIESQILILDKMFTSHLWDAVISLCEEIVDDISLDIVDTVKQYYGLALFNVQKYSMAADLFKGLYQKKHIENICLYLTLAEIKNICEEWCAGHYEHRARLAELVGQLDTLKDNRQYKSNIRLVAMLYLETAYYLGLSEKKYLENAIERYHEFAEEVKKDSMVKYLYALCLELNGNVETAEAIYAELEWQDDANIARRYLTCKLSRNKYEEVLKLYREIHLSVINAELKNLYLIGLYYAERDRYEDTLKEFLGEFQDDFESIIDIARGIQETCYLQEHVIPLISNYLSTECDSLSIAKKAELLSILSHTGELELVLIVLKAIPEISALSQVVIRDIYDATFGVSNTEYINHDKSLIKSSKLEATEQIADIFLKAEVSKREFLQIKFLCAGAKEKKFSMLKYAKELFEITRDESMARNIIALLFERNERNYNVYEPYIDALKNSTIPSYCMAIAAAMLRLGKTDEADLYAYKALYYLNDKEDYEIYESYFSYYNKSLSRYHNDDKRKSVRGSSVVTMEEDSTVSGQRARVIVLCLDSESEFDDESNMSMEVRHIPFRNPLYLKIQGCTLKQVLKIDGINYRLTNIESRTSYAARFIFGKISAKPEEFIGTVQVLKFEKPKDFIEQIKLLTDTGEQTEKLLDLYHFKGGKTGLPIDLFIDGNYDWYIDALKMLLYSKDQAFYAGLPMYLDEENQEYIPTLSTLVLLSVMNIMSLLDRIKSNILMPSSYVSFFMDRYIYAKESGSVSLGKLTNINNQLTLLEYDSSCIEIWERIIDFCASCKTIEILDTERINFSFGKDLNGEQFLSAAQLHVIQLDAFILAKKERAIYLCDDLFFRKMAAFEKIKNVNSASLLLHYEDQDFAAPIVMELSKTNYLYIPLLARTDEEERELEENILEGKFKKKYYSNILTAYSTVRERVARVLSGEGMEFKATE